MANMCKCVRVNVCKQKEPIVSNHQITYNYNDGRLTTKPTIYIQLSLFYSQKPPLLSHNNPCFRFYNTQTLLHTYSLYLSPFKQYTLFYNIILYFYFNLFHLLFFLLSFIFLYVCLYLYYNFFLSLYSIYFFVFSFLIFYLIYSINSFSLF